MGKCMSSCIQNFQYDLGNIINAQISKQIVRFQAIFRRYIKRKKILKLLFDQQRVIWDHIFSNVNMNLTQFNENYIKFNLRYMITSFYDYIFTSALEKQYIMTETNYILHNPDNFVTNFKPLILLHLNKVFYLGKLRKDLKHLSVEYAIDDNLFDKLDYYDDYFTAKNSKRPSDKSDSGFNIQLNSQSRRYSYVSQFQTLEALKSKNTSRFSLYLSRTGVGHSPIKEFNKPSKFFNSFAKENVFNRVRVIPQESTKEEEYNNTISSHKFSTLNSENNYAGRIKLIDSQSSLVIESILEEFNQHSHISITTFDRENGIYYTGDWNLKQQCKSKFGIEYSTRWEVGVRYKYMGYFKTNKFHGYGVLIREDGCNYQGEFREGKQCGFGIETHNNRIYQGFFYENIYHGYGELTVDGMIKYRGCFNMGMKTNIGMTNNDDGTKYIGNYLNGKIFDFGAFLWKEGHSYYGQWKNEKMDGKGKFTWINGDVFVGTYVNDLKCGEGEYFFADQQSILRGIWQNGIKSGMFELFKGKERFNLIYKNDQQVVYKK
jgi:hypothetical protein